MSITQYLLGLLLSLPIAAAYYYNLNQNSLELLSALIAVLLFVFSTTSLISKIGTVGRKLTISLIIFTPLVIYLYAQLLSLYIQGAYINQQFFFHFNLTTLFETWKIYLNLVALFLVLIAGIVLTLWFFARSSRISPHRSKLLLAVLLLSVVVEPWVRSTSITAMRSFAYSASNSLDEIPWEAEGLNRHALSGDKLEAVAGKNVVIVFLEGLESVYTDNNVFPELTPRLNSLALDSWGLKDLQQVDGSSWTMGGLVSTLCGTPLLYKSFLNGNSIMNTTFLDKVNCLGDVLAAADYEQVFMGGASLDFGGKGKFLNQHGYDSVLGKSELTNRLPDPSYLGAWGLFDDSLFSLAAAEFDRLAERDSPFNLTMLTVDTHHPSGEVSRSCPPYLLIDNSILHAVHCTDYLLGLFIDHIQAHPAYRDTVVMLLSDHLAFPNAATSLFPENYQRRNYLSLLNTGVDVPEVGESAPMDIAPTLLSLLDVNHNAAFLAGENLLEQQAGDREVELSSLSRINNIRYINSNFLSSLSSFEQIYSFEKDGWGDVKFSDQVANVKANDGVLEFASTGDDPYFILPDFGRPDGTRIQVLIELEVPQEGALRIYYSGPAEDGFSESRWLSQPTNTGANELIFELESEQTSGQLRIDPGVELGQYKFKTLEVRDVN